MKGKSERNFHGVSFQNFLPTSHFPLPTFSFPHVFNSFSTLFHTVVEKRVEKARIFPKDFPPAPFVRSAEKQNPAEKAPYFLKFRATDKGRHRAPGARTCRKLFSEGFRKTAGLSETDRKNPFRAPVFHSLAERLCFFKPQKSFFPRSLSLRHPRSVALCPAESTPKIGFPHFVSAFSRGFLSVVPRETERRRLI